MNSEDSEWSKPNNQTEDDVLKTNSLNEQVEGAVRNTITLAQLQKKRLKMQIIAVLMVYIAIKATYGIFIDSTPTDYNNLPMIVVYILFAIYVIATCLVQTKHLNETKEDLICYYHQI